MPDDRAAEGLIMAKKLYVGNLNYRTTEERLKNVLFSYGNVVSAVVITDKISGQSKGFGFVELETEDTAAAALAALNNTVLDGRKIRVNYAEEQNRDRPYNRMTGSGKKKTVDRRGHPASVPDFPEA